MWFILEALLFSIGFTALLRVLWSQECTHYRQTANNQNAVHGGQQQHDTQSHRPPAISIPAEQVEDASGQPSAAEQAENSNAQQRPRKWTWPLRKWKNIKRATVVGSFAVAFAIMVLAFVQAYITGGQLGVMQFEQRSWLNVGLPSASPGQLENEVKAAVTIENTGQCPATIYYATFMYVTGKDLADIADDVQAIESAPSDGYGARQMVVAPSWDFRQGVPGSGTHFASNLYLVCHIRYSDMFGSDHRSQWCFEYGETKDGKPKFFTALRYNYMK